MKKPHLIELSAAIRRIESSPRVVITSHARADGDAVGCVSAMARVLRHRGAQVAALLHEPVQERYAFLTSQEPPGIWDPNTAATVLEGADLLLILDTCAASQLAPIDSAVKAAALPKLAIDHHLTRDDIADEAYVDSQAAACAQILTRLLEEARWPLDAPTAELLYAGLATDTGWFRFSNANAASFAAASRLVAAGARPAELYERLYLNDTTPRARLIGAVMTDFQLLVEGRLAVVRLGREVFQRCGATQQMTEDLINEPQRVGSVNACVLLVEPPDEGPIRVSLRSKRDIDVAAIAARFGGGGHARAAGARVKGTMDEVAKRVTDAMLGAMSGK
jgi:phosphoesterase RecJ-like protein